jgi:hypothetical protein
MESIMVINLLYLNPCKLILFFLFFILLIYGNNPIHANEQSIDKKKAFTTPHTDSELQVIGKIELLTKGISIESKNKKKRTPPGSIDAALRKEGKPVSLTIINREIINTGNHGRCRIKLNNGSILTLGPDTITKLIFDSDKKQEIILKQGRMMLYQAPVSLTTEPSKVSIKTIHGQAEFQTGKAIFLFNSKDKKTEIYCLNNHILFNYPALGTEVITKGHKFTAENKSHIIEKASSSGLKNLISETSPGIKILNAAITRFNKKDLTGAEKLFSAVQSVFPYNDASAWYLGLISLKNDNKEKAIQQWQRYQIINPKQAKKRNIKQYLTILITDQLKDEVKAALKNENKLANIQVEQNSVGIIPFTNKGDSKYRYISKGITAILTSDLAKIPGLKVLERNKVQILINEIKLSQAELSDQGTAVKTGKFLKAEKMVLGQYTVKKSP